MISYCPAAISLSSSMNIKIFRHCDINPFFFSLHFLKLQELYGVDYINRHFFVRLVLQSKFKRQRGFGRIRI